MYPTMTLNRVQNAYFQLQPVICPVYINIIKQVLGSRHLTQDCLWTYIPDYQQHRNTIAIFLQRLHMYIIHT